MKKFQELEEDVISDQVQEILKKLNAACGDDINHHRVDDDLGIDMDDEGDSEEEEPHIQRQAMVEEQERQERQGLDYVVQRLSLSLCEGVQSITITRSCAATGCTSAKSTTRTV